MLRGDISRKRKRIEKQKEGKKGMKSIAGLGRGSAWESTSSRWSQSQVCGTGATKEILLANRLVALLDPPLQFAHFFASEINVHRGPAA